MSLIDRLADSFTLDQIGMFTLLGLAFLMMAIFFLTGGGKRD